jgi:hypothetical protein
MSDIPPMKHERLSYPWGIGRMIDDGISMPKESVEKLHLERKQRVYIANVRVAHLWHHLKSISSRFLSRTGYLWTCCFELYLLLLL